MKEIIFKEMQEEDLPAVLDIYNHCIETTTATFDPEPILMETLKTRIPLNHDFYKAYSTHHTDSIEFFRKQGWEQCAHFMKVGEKWGRAIDVVFFHKSLENAQT